MKCFTLSLQRYCQIPSGATQKQVTMTSISQKASFSKWLRWSSFLGGSGCVALRPLKMVFVKNTRLHGHLILKFCLNFGNKNTEILLQLSGKRLTTCIIHSFDFTTHNYRMSALQIQCWYKYPISGVFLSVSTRFKILQEKIISWKYASRKKLENVLLTSRFYQDLQNLVWL